MRSERMQSGIAGYVTTLKIGHGNRGQYNAEIVSGLCCDGTGYLGFTFKQAVNAALAQQENKL